jgi:hypothetical protein
MALRDEVVLRVVTASGEVASLRMPFAANRVAVAPNGQVAAVAGDGELAVIDYGSGAGETRWSTRVRAAGAAMRIAVDDDGAVVLSSAEDTVVTRVVDDTQQRSIDLPAGFHESLVLIPGVGAHVVISGETSLSAVAAFDAGELVPLDNAEPYGAVRIGHRLGVFTMDQLRVYDVAASGAATVVSEHTLDGVERVVSNPSGTEVLTVAAKWNGEVDVLHLERIALDSDKRTEVDATAVGRGDAFALTDDGELVRAYGDSQPGRMFAVCGGQTFEVNVDDEVAKQRT